MSLDRIPAKTMKLTDAKLRSLKATGKVQKIADGGGLYIHVTAVGAKLWRMDYRFGASKKHLLWANILMSAW